MRGLWCRGAFGALGSLGRRTRSLGSTAVTTVAAGGTGNSSSLIAGLACAPVVAAAAAQKASGEAGLSVVVGRRIGAGGSLRMPAFHSCNVGRAHGATIFQAFSQALASAALPFGVATLAAVVGALAEASLVTTVGSLLLLRGFCAPRESAGLGSFRGMGSPPPLGVASLATPLHHQSRIYVCVTRN